jgi:glycosyltransferase involved in cell wall biosynthesis
MSVVIRSKDEADRLRLTLASLRQQNAQDEVIVVNDGSIDHTPAVLADATDALRLKIVNHPSPLGRSRAANAGAALATGDVLLFLDGDTLAGPNFAERHLAAHHRYVNLIGRGETYHIRKTRFLRDPESGTPQPGHEARLAKLKAEERNFLRVTQPQILENFRSIERCSEPGIYPGAGPRRLYELEMDALNNHADCPVLWAAASGSNFSVPRSLFEKAGGFDPDIDINEHRELALRLCKVAGQMRPIAGARTYHLTHRTGWRDPLQDLNWEKKFYEKHPISAVKLLIVFWASLTGGDLVPPSARITSLPALALASISNGLSEYEEVRRRICARAGR